MLEQSKCASVARKCADSDSDSETMVLKGGGRSRITALQIDSLRALIEVRIIK